MGATALEHKLRTALRADAGSYLFFKIFFHLSSFLIMEKSTVSISPSPG